MKIQFDSFIRILRLLGTLCFCAVFLYWSINAINKYIDGPISSTVSYQFGDDGNGNIEFPAISICLDSFKWVVLSGISKNCSTSAANIPRLTDALRYCTAETLINDLDTGPFVKIGYEDSIFAEISKSNLDSIATEITIFLLGFPHK